MAGLFGFTSEQRARPKEKQLRKKSLPGLLVYRDMERLTGNNLDHYHQSNCDDVVYSVLKSTKSQKRTIGNEMNCRTLRSNKARQGKSRETFSADSDHPRCHINQSASIITKRTLSYNEDACFNVNVFGYYKVGKSLLIQQLLTMTRSRNQSKIVEESSECHSSTTVLLDEQTSINYTENYTDVMIGCDINYTDAYVVVFSVSDTASFQWAAEKVAEIRSRTKGKDIFIVANKIDLVRSRTVPQKCVKSFCKKFDCKYIEVSLVLEYQVASLHLQMTRKLHKSTREKNTVLSSVKRFGERLLNKK